MPKCPAKELKKLWSSNIDQRLLQNYKQQWQTVLPAAAAKSSRKKI